MSGSFAAALRQRAQLARTALEAAHHDDDANALIAAEGEWDDIVRLAHAHSVPIHPESNEPDSGTTL